MKGSLGFLVGSISRIRHKGSVLVVSEMLSVVFEMYVFLCIASNDILYA